MAFTYFFRDLQTLHLIRDYVIPVLRSRRYMNIWDAGCAHGPEPYTLSIILRENMGRMIFRNVKIYATDIDKSNLFREIIESGVYPEEQVKRIPKDIFNKYFSSCEKPGYFQLNEEIRKSLEFTRQDLLRLEPIRDNLSLIVCKNVLLHFNYEMRIKVLRMFYDSLDKGGFLAMEQTQELPKEVGHLFTSVVSNARIYRKAG